MKKNNRLIGAGNTSAVLESIVMDSVNTDTHFVNTFSEQDNHNISKKIIDEVKEFIASDVIAIKNNDNSIITLPAKKRGNAFYNLDIAAKMAVINRQAVKLLRADTENLKTNTFFITLTTHYDPKEPEKTTLRALARVNSRLPKFLRYMRKNYKKCSYIWAKEAHKDGGCHVHMIVQCKQLYQFFRHIDSDGVETFRSDELRADIKTAWAIGNIDVQGVMRDSGVFAYVSKELGKSQNVEKALKRIQNGEELKKNDTNKIWLLWAVNTLAKIHRIKTGKKTVIRIIGYSKTYKVTEEEHREERKKILQDSASINNKSKPTQETERKPIKVCILGKSLVKNLPFTVKTGEITDNFEYLTLNSLIERYGNPIKGDISLKNYLLSLYEKPEK